MKLNNFTFQLTLLDDIIRKLASGEQQLLKPLCTRIVRTVMQKTGVSHSRLLDLMVSV